MAPKLLWYWHRFRAMSPEEVIGHVRKKLRQKADGKGAPNFSNFSFDSSDKPAFPVLPKKSVLPETLRAALAKDTADILAGRWKAFGHIDLKVDDPPRWQNDYLVGKDFETQDSAFHLNYRQQPDGADIKLIWEPSRWNQLVRLAQAAYLLDHASARETCIRWLKHWLEHNPPYRGLNWTSALETGMRLVQYVWIDALLAGAGTSPAVLDELRRKVVLPHVWYTWRYISFGSSANNHLLGELAGLITAIARWPMLERISTSLNGLHRLLEQEVLFQFAPDGGNREQALGYHLFSWEFCWQSEMALRAAGKKISAEVEERIRRGAQFYAAVKIEKDVWDYGDSDNAFVTPFCADETRVAEEWRTWFVDSAKSPALSFWWGDFAARRSESAKLASAQGWQLFDQSGYAVYRSPDWTLRWDLSNLGYLATAAHGHLDALHLSVWHRGVPFVIDPGTGAYYSDKALRDYFASWQAHNGPHPVDCPFPQRLGTFLWGTPHAKPKLVSESDEREVASLDLPQGRPVRRITPLPGGAGWQVEDGFEPARGGAPSFAVRWQFPPGAEFKRLSDRRFEVRKDGVSLLIEIGSGWSKVEPFIPSAVQSTMHGFAMKDLGNVPLEAVCSPAFRRLAVGPFLLLTATGGGTSGFQTIFRAGSSKPETAR